VLVWLAIRRRNTSDDGYLLTMARVSEHGAIMANYYRLVRHARAPFGLW